MNRLRDRNGAQPVCKEVTILDSIAREQVVEALLARLNLLWDQMIEARQAYGAAHGHEEKQLEHYNELQKLNAKFGLCWNELSHAGHYPAAREGGGFQ